MAAIDKLEQRGENKEEIGVEEKRTPAAVGLEPLPGRPLLHWRGKRPLRTVKYCEAELKEQYGVEGKDGWINRLYWGDNLQVMSHLVREFRGQIKLIYIDPPFDSGANYWKKIKLKGQAREGTPSVVEQKQYSDIWADDGYLQFIYERLQLMRELLSPDGSLYVHMDYRRGHYVKVILDEIFGPNNFRNEIVVRRATKNLQNQFEEVAMLNVATDSIFWYSRTPEARYKAPVKSSSSRQRRGRWAGFFNDQDRPSMRYELFGQLPTRGQWKWNKARAYQAAANYEEYLRNYAGQMSLEEYWEKTGRRLEFLRPNPRTGKPEYWVEPKEEVPCDTNWLDIPAYAHRTGYPTEKSEALLERIIRAATEPGDLVADFFCGSGTTLFVAQRLGRRWIGSDINLGAIHTTVKRLLPLVGQQAQDEPGPKVYPAFAVFRVKHYHVAKHVPEAKEVVMKLYGIEPISGSFFDGILDGKWVKVIDLNRVCTKEDVEAVLAAVPSQDGPGMARAGCQGILLLCSGHEYGLREYARSRNVLNIPLEIREIFTDGRDIFCRQPPEVDIALRREGDSAVIEIRQFHSPLVWQKLQKERGPGEAVDWRQMVEAVLIDPDYDGRVLRPALQDVPEGPETVKGVYRVSPARPGQKIAIKIVDVLSGECLTVLDSPA
ncbi:site-specific DNA-methyltransferase [Moorellaceae bacterium AZ2]